MKAFQNIKGLLTGQPAGVTTAERVVVRYPYKSENADELTIDKGDIITIIDKHLEDDGWWKGELNGKIGVFPDNFVEPYTPPGSSNKDDKAKPSRPVPPLPSDKPASEKSLKRSGPPPPVVPKKPGAGAKTATNGRANPPDSKGDGLFDNMPDHQPLQTLTSDRPRVANKRLPSKEFLKNAGEEDSVEKEEEKPIKTDPPPRPIHKPIVPAARSEPAAPQAAFKAATMSSARAAPAPPLPQHPPPVPSEPSASAADLAELRREFESRLAQEMRDVRAEVERVRTGLTARIHALTAEVDEEKRLRHSAQVELERVRKMLQERELAPVGGAHLSSAGPHSSNA